MHIEGSNMLKGSRMCRITSLRKSWKSNRRGVATDLRVRCCKFLNLFVNLII